jgi:hypothetical protein
MSMTITGRIHQIFETKEVGAKGFKKREFVVETEEKYPQLLSIEATQDRTGALDAYSVGDTVTVSVNLKGRKWDGPNGTKYFNTIECWKIEGNATPKSAGSTSGGSESPQDAIPFANCSLAAEPSPIARILR